MSYEHKTLPGEKHWQFDGEFLPVEKDSVANHPDLHMYMYNDQDVESEDSWNIATLKSIEVALLPFQIALHQDGKLDQSQVNDLIVRICSTSRELDRALIVSQENEIESLDFAQLKKIARARTLTIHALLARKHAEI